MAELEERTGTRFSWSFEAGRPLQVESLLDNHHADESQSKETSFKFEMSQTNGTNCKPIIFRVFILNLLILLALTLKPKGKCEL